MSVIIGPPSYVSDNLVLFLDAGNPASYPGYGSDWFDITPNRNLATNGATLLGDNIPTYSSDYGGLLFVDNQSVNDFLPTGPTGYIWVSFDYDLSPATTLLTFEMWIRLYRAGTNNTSSILTFGNRYSLSWRSQNQRLAFFPSSEAGSGGFGLDFTDEEVGKWYHMVLVVNADATKDGVANNKIYLNGVSQVLDTSISPFTGPSGWANFSPDNILSKFRFMLGYQYNAGMWVPPSSTDGRKGRYDISILRIYNGELTQDQVTQNFNSLRGRYGI
jgi:hypothetical protein